MWGVKQAKNWHKEIKASVDQLRSKAKKILKETNETTAIF